MSDGLFNPAAFEQMPGQMSMAAVESTFTALSPASSDCALCHGRGFLLPAGAGCGACHGRGVIDRLPWQPPCGRSSCAERECCASRDDCPCGIGDER